MMLPLRIELAMTFKAVFLNFWPSANPDIVSEGPNRAVSGCNILILPVDASVLPPFQEECLRAVTALFAGLIGGAVGELDRLGVVVGEIDGNRELPGFRIEDAAPAVDPG